MMIAIRKANYTIPLLIGSYAPIIIQAPVDKEMKRATEAQKLIVKEKEMLYYDKES